MNKEKLAEALESCRDLRSDLTNLESDITYIRRKADELMGIIEEIEEINENI